MISNYDKIKIEKVFDRLYDRIAITEHVYLNIIKDYIDILKEEMIEK